MINCTTHGTLRTSRKRTSHFFGCVSGVCDGLLHIPAHGVAAIATPITLRSAQPFKLTPKRLVKADLYCSASGESSECLGENCPSTSYEWLWWWWLVCPSRRFTPLVSPSFVSG